MIRTFGAVRDYRSRIFCRYLYVTVTQRIGVLFFFFFLLRSRSQIISGANVRATRDVIVAEIRGRPSSGNPRRRISTIARSSHRGTRVALRAHRSIVLRSHIRASTFAASLLFSPLFPATVSDAASPTEPRSLLARHVPVTRGSRVASFRFRLLVARLRLSLSCCRFPSRRVASHRGDETGPEVVLSVRHGAP